MASSLLLISIAIGCSSSDSKNPTTGTPDAGSTTSSSGGSTSSSSGGKVDGGDSGGGATGTVDGHAFTFANGIAFPTKVGDNGDTDGYEIYLSNQALDCDNFKIEGGATVDIDLAGTPPAAQTYTAIEAYDKSAGTGEASADFNAYDATCKTLTSTSSKSGSVVITKFDTSSVTGSFNITFETSARAEVGSISGTFTATVCSKTPAPSCTPQ